jgi:hypothetical protein
VPQTCQLPARLAGVDISKYEDESLAELKARTPNVAFWNRSNRNRSIAQWAISLFLNQHLEQRSIILSRTANVISVTTAYNILRHNGLDIGKRDFMGG